MNEPDWKNIPARLHAAGFAVSYARVSYSHTDPLWRAHACREGREWNSEGRDLETTLVRLEQRTHEASHPVAELAA